VPAINTLRAGDPPRLGAYTLTGRLGAGGQGVVYLGRTGTGDKVAVKVLHAHVEEATYLTRELGMAQQVASFCTAKIIDAALDADPPYIVSEFIDGPSLRDVVTTSRPFDGGALHRLAIGTVTALTAIHQAGVVHRDFKPGNVLLGPDGPRVIDFGIARALDVTATTGDLRGTPAYMSPEQMRGESAGTAADMFAWGGTMLFAATGRPPFGEDTLPNVIQRVLTAQPDLSALPPDLRGLVGACLAKNPAERPSAPEALNALLGVQSTRTAETMRQGAALAAVPDTMATARLPNPAAERGSRRGPLYVAAGGSVLLAAAIVAAAVIVSSGDQGGGPAPATVVASSSRPPSHRPTSQRPTVQRPAPHVPKQVGVPPQFAGTWRGTAIQPSSKQYPTFSLIVTLVRGSMTGTTGYPTLQCTGTLRLLSNANGVMHLRERITAGGCTDGGVFTFSLVGGKLSFSYDPRKAGAPASSGTLSRG